jgi:hypothetical protein
LIDQAAWSEYVVEEMQQRSRDNSAYLLDDEESRNIADTPYLTGDPEWDAIELQETTNGE